MRSSTTPSDDPTCSEAVSDERGVDAKLVANLYEFRLLVEPTTVQLSVPHMDASMPRKHAKLSKPPTGWAPRGTSRS